MALMGSTSGTFISFDQLVKKAKYSTLLVFLSALPLLATERFEVEREDGSKLVCYCDKPETSPFSITLIIPGSQKETARRIHDSLKDDILHINQCALTLEKQGITEEKIDEKEFNRNLSLLSRLEDHLLLLKQLQGVITGWDGKISILGQGDGGRIGAALAAKTKNVSALILIASGGGWPALEETLYAFRTEMVDQGFSPQYIHGFLVAAKQEFAQALKTPKPEHKAFGYTYKYWDSLLKTHLLEDLTHIDCPIYSVNGAKDDRVPIESVDAMAKHLKDKITFNRKDDLGREIIQDHEIYEEAISWLEQTL